MVQESQCVFISFEFVNHLNGLTCQKSAKALFGMGFGRSRRCQNGNRNVKGALLVAEGYSSATDRNRRRRTLHPCTIFHSDLGRIM